MKITFILPGIGLTGGVKVAFEYANHLQARGHEVSIVYPLILLPLLIRDPWRTSKGIVRTILEGNKVKWFDLKANLIRTPTLAERYIPDADIIVATWWRTVRYVNSYGEDKGKKFYLIQHYEIWDGPKEMVDKTYKLGLHNIVISSWLKGILQNELGAKVEALIPDAVNPNEFYPEYTRKDGGEIRILMPYRKLEWKGTEDGIKAFEIVHKKHKNTKLVMFGFRKGKDVPRYAEFHENIVTSELRRLYNSCDIFCYPSHMEGFGLPPMEAMACRIPVVTTEVGAIPDYAIPGKTALISQPKDFKALARNLIELIENPQKRDRIAKAGYQHIQQFTWEKSTDKLEKLFMQA